MKTRNQDKGTPSSEPSRRSTGGRKRRASSSSEVSAPPSSSQAGGASASHANKRRRHARTASVTSRDTPDSDDDDVQSQTQALEQIREDSEAPVAVDVETSETVTVTEQPGEGSSRHVRFTETATQSGNDSTNTNLTPFVRKKTFDRRATISPYGASSHQRNGVSKGKSRASLPATFSPYDSPSKRVQELQFLPLSQVLKERVKRRLRRSHLSEETNSIQERERIAARERRRELEQLREDIAERDQKVRDLLYQLDLQKQLGIDVGHEREESRRKIDEMEDEVKRLRVEIEEFQEQEAAIPQFDGMDDSMDGIEEDMLIYHGDSPIRADGEDGQVLYPDLAATEGNELAASNNSTPSRAIKTDASTPELSNAETQVYIPEYSVQQERDEFEKAIRFWTREASDAKASLQILTIELQSLGFGDSTTTPEAVLTSIRNSFLYLREKMESALPGQVPGETSNHDLVELVANHLEALAVRAAEQNHFLDDADSLQHELVREINGLVERLSQAEIRKRQLEQTFSELDAQSQADEVIIHELENKFRTVSADHEMIEKALEEKKAYLADVEKEKAELELSIEKLGAALDGYRGEESKLHAMIEKMETQHVLEVQQLKKERNDTVGNLEVELSDETAKREDAEADATNKQTMITGLESRIEEDEAAMAKLKAQLAALEEERAGEQEAKESAEGDRDQKAAFIEELEEKISRAEDELDNFRVELDRLRQLRESEQRQRESAEELLDARDSKVAELENKLHENGVVANQLRQKLFEIQIREKEAIMRLEADAQEREDKFQNDFADEVNRREDAESQIANRNVVIAELEEKLREVEEHMRQTITDRDSRIAELQLENQQLQSELAETRQERDTTAVGLAALQSSTSQRISELETDVANLESTIAEATTTIESLSAEAESTAESNDAAIAQRDQQIADLNHAIYDAQQNIAQLESDRASLERRVEAEAESMLELQASKDQHIAALNDTIRQKQDEIQDLGRKATEVDDAWEELIAERDEEIDSLRTSGEQSAGAVSKLQETVAALKDKFRKYVRDSTATSAAMIEDLETALAAQHDKSKRLVAYGEQALEEVEAMDAVGELPAREAQNGAGAENKLLKRVGGRKSSRRQYDSGIGVEEGESSMMAE